MKLNIGCGRVRLAGYVGVDANPGGAADALGLAQALPFRPGRFQEVRASHVLEHLPDLALDGAMREIHRILEPGGRAVIRVPYGLDSLYFPFHFHAFNERTFDEWLAETPVGPGLQPDQLFTQESQRVVRHRGGFPTWHMHRFLSRYLPRLARLLFYPDKGDGRIRLRVPWYGARELDVVLVKKEAGL